MLSLLSSYLLSGEVTCHEFRLGTRHIRLWIDEKRLALSLIVLCTSLSWQAMLVLNTSLFLEDLAQIRINDPWVSVDSVELSRGVLLLIHVLACLLFLRLFLYAVLLHMISYLAVNHQTDILEAADPIRVLLAEKLVSLYERFSRQDKTD
ncbi:hypothetical protein EBZ80_01915 [bacterium]|nr:hypothetical protein [bacterium]